MATKQRVLSYLEQQRGTPVSGEGLAAALSVSRTAIWKAVKDLQTDGHPIEAVTNRGYTLRQDSNMLSPEGVRPFLSYDCPMLVVEQVIDSTNLQAKYLAAKGAPHGTLVIADQQTGGRGRRGRSFLSPSGSGLYLTLVLRTGLSMESAALITCAAAVATRRAIAAVCGKDVQIKWVNDLYYNGKKCCGILTEAAADMESGGMDYVVVGVGINVRTPQGGFPPDLDNIATALFAAEETPSRCALAAAVANELMTLCSTLPCKNFMQEYRTANLIPGKDITVLQNGTQRPAKALAITDDGHLEIENADGTQEEISFGEVSVRF